MEKQLVVALEEEKVIKKYLCFSLTALEFLSLEVSLHPHLIGQPLHYRQMPSPPRRNGQKKDLKQEYEIS